jgi:hypothetical protein
VLASRWSAPACQQPCFIGPSSRLPAWAVQVGRGHRQAEQRLAGNALPGQHHRLHIRHRVPQIGHRRSSGARGRAEKLGGKPQQPGGIGFVGGIPHGDQRRGAEAEAGFEHEAGRGGFGAADEAPGDPLPREGVEEIRAHQQGFAADEALPGRRIPVGIPTEVEAAEHLHQLGKSRQRGAAMAAQQLKGRFPVVVPASFPLEGIDAFIAGAPSAEVP